MNTAKLEKLFEAYEDAFRKLDFKSIGALYAENFIAAGPKGTISHNRQEFLKNAEQASSFYRSIGQKDARILSKEILYISNEYCMVTVHWEVKFRKTGDEPIQFDVSYIVQDAGDQLKLILFISHEDEVEAMKKLGLQTA